MVTAYKELDGNFDFRISAVYFTHFLEEGGSANLKINLALPSFYIQNFFNLIFGLLRAYISRKLVVERNIFKILNFESGSANLSQALFLWYNWYNSENLDNLMK